MPLFCLNSLDDPIVHRSLIPLSHALHNPNLLFATTHGGGHLGWLHGLNPFDQSGSWMEQLCVQYAHAIVHGKPPTNALRCAALCRSLSLPAVLPLVSSLIDSIRLCDVMRCDVMWCDVSQS